MAPFFCFLNSNLMPQRNWRLESAWCCAPTSTFWIWFWHQEYLFTFPCLPTVDSSAQWAHNFSLSFPVCLKRAREINIDGFSAALTVPTLLVPFPAAPPPHHPLQWEPRDELLSTCSTPSPCCCLHSACLRISSREESVPAVVWCWEGENLSGLGSLGSGCWDRLGEPYA